MESLKYDLAKIPLREVNQFLHSDASLLNGKHIEINNPNGAHNIAVGLRSEATVTIHGHAGYYAAGMNQIADVTIEGSVGSGVAENMMSGRVHVKGFASNAAGATANGGLLVIDGDAGEGLGDSIYEARLFVRGKVKSLGADCEVKTMSLEDRKILVDLLERSGHGDVSPESFTLYGSARTLYHFNVAKSGAY